MTCAEADLRNPFSSLIDSETWLLLTRLSKFLTGQDIKSYIVGGLVRDTLLGRDTADIDLAVAADAPEAAKKVADALGGRYVLLDKANRIGRVVLADETAPPTRAKLEIDFSTIEGSIEQDLAQRDFTIDAMAIELSLSGKDGAEARLIDPFHGRDDLRQGIIRAVSDTVFEADAVRLLRAVRLAAELGSSIDAGTEALIRRDSRFVGGVAGERVREELLWLLAIPGIGQSLPYLDELGLLTELFPEMTETKGVRQPREHSWDVFNHSLKTVVALEFLLGQGDWEYAGREVLDVIPWSPELARHFEEEVSHGSTRRSLLKLAALLHDVSKPRTRAIDENGRTRFLGHAGEGADLVAERLEKLRFSTREIKLVETEVRHHLRPGQMSQEGMPSDRAIYRYFRDTGDAGIDILFLNLADHLAARGPNLDLPNWQEHARQVEYVLSRHAEQENVARPPKLVDGHDIISSLGVSPGPKIGEALEALREAQAAGEVTDRQEALAFIERLLSPPGSLEEKRKQNKKRGV